MSKYRWQKEEVDFLKRAYGTTSTKQIAEALGRSVQSVWHKASQLGLQKENKSKNNQEDVITPEKKKILDEIERVKSARVRTAKKYYKCAECNQIKLGKYFSFSNKYMDRNGYCNACKKKHAESKKVNRIIEGRDW